MDREEALKLLANAPKTETPSRVNPVFTQAQAIALVEAAVEEMTEGQTLDRLTEKRVLQVTQNLRRPVR